MIGGGILMCDAKDCTVDVPTLLLEIDDGKVSVALCYSHATAWGAGVLDLANEKEVDTKESQTKTMGKCMLCEGQAIVFKCHEAEFIVCEEHAKKVMAKALNPTEFHKMYGDIKKTKKILQNH